MTISTNRRAFHEYTIEETLEAGISLIGSEVKSIRAGKISLKEGWVHFTDDGEALLENVHIGRYSHASYDAPEEKRTRTLLLKKKQILKLAQKVQAKGMTVVPIKVYFKAQWVKIQIGLAKGKHLYDKRQSKKEQDAKKDIERAFSERQKKHRD